MKFFLPIFTQGFEGKNVRGQYFAILFINLPLERNLIKGEGEFRSERYFEIRDFVQFLILESSSKGYRKYKIVLEQFLRISFNWKKLTRPQTGFTLSLFPLKNTTPKKEKILNNKVTCHENSLHDSFSTSIKSSEPPNFIVSPRTGITFARNSPRWRTISADLWTRGACKRRCLRLASGKRVHLVECLRRKERPGFVPRITNHLDRRSISFSIRLAWPTIRIRGSPPFRISRSGRP